MTKNKPIIKFNNFSYIYPNTTEQALSNIDFEINKGDFVGIIGGNKAGKSTLCLAMVGILPYVMGGEWDGHVEVGDYNLDETSGVGATEVIGIIFQDAESQFTQETVEDEIAFAMCNFGYEKDLMLERVDMAARAAGLRDMLDRSPLRLSGGQQQRLAIASILALEPEVIVLDESTSQLDPIGRDEVFGLVSELHKRGHTIIMVEHNIEKVAEYADKVIVLNDGKLEFYGETEEILTKREELEKFNLRIPQVSEAFIDVVGEIENIPITLDDAVKEFKERGIYGK